MAFDFIDEDPGTGVDKKPVATQILPDGSHAQVVTDVGTESIAHGAINVAIGSGVILAANPTRRRVRFYHRAVATHGDVYIGGVGVAAGSGAFLPAEAGKWVEVQSRAAIHGIAVGVAADISYLEELE